MTSPEDKPVVAEKRTSTEVLWANFWPSLVSTIVGIVIGVPIALWLAHYGMSIQEQARQAEEGARLKRGLQTLATSVRHNSERLRDLSESLRKDQVPFDVGLDVSAWDVSKQEVIPFLKDAEMQRRIAHHFTRAESVRRLGGLLLDQSVGVASALQGASQTRKGLSSYLLRECDSLLQEAEQLANDIRKASERKAG